MFGTQNETRLKPEGQRPRVSRFAPRGFTLTELLVVITIIAILAGLITGAVFTAMGKANQARITLELQQLGNAMEDLKNDLGAYPPNAITSGASPTSGEVNAVRSDLQRALKKAFPRINSNELALVNRLIGDTSLSGTNAFLPNGLSASEALVFWAGGFSSDVTLPFSGPGGPSFLVAEGEIVENRNWGDGYEFDLGRLGPRDANGVFNGRYILYQDSLGQNRRINFWTYVPNGSLKPIVYFDTSNITPEKRFSGAYNYELRSSADPNDAAAPVIFPLREALETVTILNPGVAQTKYVNQGKFQILHCGIDDIWGDFSTLSSTSAVNTTALSTDVDGNPLALLVPTGPFIGDIADTVGNFMTGTLEDEQE